MGALAASMGPQVGAAIHQGILNYRDAKAAVKAEKQGLLDRTDQRLLAMRQVRGAQRTAQAAAGMAFNSGSFAAIEKARETDYVVQQGIDATNTKKRMGALKTQGLNQLVMGALGGTSTAAAAFLAYRNQGPVIAPRAGTTATAAGSSASVAAGQSMRLTPDGKVR